MYLLATNPKEVVSLLAYWGRQVQRIHLNNFSPYIITDYSHIGEVQMFQKIFSVLYVNQNMLY